MKPPATRFVTVCAARTGSTLLMTYIQSHRDIVAHGEVLAPRGPLDFYGVNYALDPPLEALLMARRDLSPVSFLHEYVWQAGRRSAVGFKAKYEELSLPQYSAVAEALFADRDVRVIHLRRDNLLARFLSQHLAVHVTKVYNVHTDRPAVDLPAVELSPDECRADFEKTERRVALFRDQFAQHDSLELAYEELVTEPGATLHRVQRFLGVEPDRELKSGLRRLRSRPLHESISNFDELRSHFEGTRWSSFFTPHSE